MKDNKNIFIMILTVVLLWLVFVFIPERVSEVKANPVENNMMTPSSNVRYSTIYYNGSTFVVFSNLSCSDIEVIKVN